jgi:hypothetical protein
MSEREIVYSAQNADPLRMGFGDWLFNVYNPRGSDGQEVIDRALRDQGFPRGLTTRETLELHMRLRRWPWRARRAARTVFSRYAAWRKAQALADLRSAA